MMRVQEIWMLHLMIPGQAMQRKIAVSMQNGAAHLCDDLSQPLGTALHPQQGSTSVYLEAGQKPKDQNIGMASLQQLQDQTFLRAEQQQNACMKSATADNCMHFSSLLLYEILWPDVESAYVVRRKC